MIIVLIEDDVGVGYERLKMFLEQLSITYVLGTF